MQSLKASTRGLARLRQARQRITQEKGWAVDHQKWLEQASGFLPLVKNGKGMVPGTVGISTWKRFLAGEPVKPTNFKAFCQVLGLNWEEVVDADTVIRPQSGNAYEEATIIQHSHREAAGDNLIPNPKSQIPNRADWGEAMDVSVFYGRTEELATLKQWIVQDKCRLVGLLGMGGMGKTALSVKFAQQVQHEFNSVIWRSLQNAPPVNDILATLIQILSNQQETPANLPESTSLRITRLIEYLRSSRCLLILDNAESILQAGAVAGQYRPGYEGYGEFIKRLGQTSHRSCLILTSCEKPQELAALEGETLPVRSLELTGLHEEEARAIFQSKGDFSGSQEEWHQVIQHYAGNPLALNLVAVATLEVFGNSISPLTKYLKAGSCPFDDTGQLLERQFHRLTALEKEVMYWLAINREPIFLSKLREDIISAVNQQQLPNTLKSLRRKLLIQITQDLFTLKPVIMGYVTKRFIAKVCHEIETEKISLLNSHALLKPQAKESVRNTQIYFIVQPIKDRLLHNLKGKSNVENQLNKIISHWQANYPQMPGYIADNVANLLQQLNAEFKEP
jgi:hypothetical protein